MKSPKGWRTIAKVVVAIAALVTLTVSLINEYQAERKIEEGNAHVAKQLKAEIAYQATRIKECLENVIRYKEDGDKSKLGVALSELLLQVAGKDTSGGFPANLFSEYAGQNMASLLSQLKLVLKSDSSIQQTLDATIISTVQLQNMSADIHTDNPKTTITKLIEGTKRQLKDLGAVTRESYLSNDGTSD